jgi:dTDP-4-dehydrorhamnose reductase
VFKKAAIFGSAGQLGIELMREFKARGYDVRGYTRATVDITDPGAVERAVTETDASVVLNAAAYNQVDLAEREPQAAYLVNALAVRNFALACRQTDARLIHFSTDYVFDGTAGRPYTEDDLPHPIGAYAVSKYAGELYAFAYLDRPLILRTSGVFGPGGRFTARGNFIELMLRLAASGQPIRVVEDHVASPTYAPELARVTADLVDRGEGGLFHAGGGTPISWFDFSRMIFRLAGINPELRPTNEREYRTQAKRPKYSALKNARLEQIGITAFEPLEKSVQDCLAARSATLPHN